MSLGVNGYLELYTTLLGWQQYQNLWDIFLKSGLAFVPFIGMLVRNIFEPLKSQEAKSATSTSLKRVEIDLLGMIFAVILCAQPIIPLTPSALSYVPICQDETKPAMPGRTGTTFDDAFPVATGTQVPIVWYAVISLSNAITRSAILGLSCHPYDYRQLHDSLAASKIQDPGLRQETKDFYDACYIQALAKYDREKPDLSPYTQKTGSADTQWMGSNAFLGMSGYYDTLSAKTPVTGFAFDPVRDFEYQNNHGQWGRPSCHDWWAGTDGQNGLKTRLSKSLPKPILSYLKTKTDAEDDAVKALITQTYQNGFQNLNDEDHGHFISKNIGMPIGIEAEKLFYYPKLMLIKAALPNIQAICLMLIYIFIAIGQPFVQYRLKPMIVIACVMFSMTFWTYIWYLIDYVDEILIQSLYPNLFGFGASPQQDFVDMVIGTCYILGPLLWTLFLGWLGLQAGSGIAGVMSGGALPAMEAGNRVGGLAQQGVSMSFTRGIPIAKNLSQK